MADTIWSLASQLAGRREPKTPMAFYLRVLMVAVVSIVALSYAEGVDSNVRAGVIVAMVVLAIVDLVWVAVLNWNRPDSLLYGAETHFEKWKMVYGTEQGAAATEDLTTTSANRQDAN